VLIAVHLVAAGTHRLPAETLERVGASAGTLLSEPWRQLTALWFHHGWGHLAYNLAVLGATWPVARRRLGPWTVPLALLASPLVGILVDLALVLPLAAADWSYAVAARDNLLVGASVAVMAGAGMAWWALPRRWHLPVAVAYVAYEAVLALGVTQPFVGVYHVAGASLGAWMGRWAGPSRPPGLMAAR